LPIIAVTLSAALVMATPSAAAPFLGANRIAFSSSVGGDVGGIAVSRLVPRTLVTVRGRIFAFAQDGGRIAYAGGRCGDIHIATLTARVEAQLRGPLCQEGYRFGDLALAGSRALWTYSWHGNQSHVDIETGAVGQRTGTLRGETSEDDCGDPDGEGEHVTGLAGDGSTLVYGIVDVEGDPNNPCSGLYTKTGGITRALGGDVPGGPAPAKLAASEHLLAVLPADATDTSSAVRPATDGPVELIDSGSGVVVTKITPVGIALAVAVSRTMVAVLLRREPGGMRIDTYDIPAGKQRSSTSVPAGAAERLSAAGSQVVFRTGKTIWLLDARDARLSVVALAAATPLGLSIEGRRIAWAENLSGRGRVRAVELPA
jgi:hypothetical protein